MITRMGQRRERSVSNDDAPPKQHSSWMQQRKQQQQQFQMPILNILLIQLDEALNGFCHHLSYPTTNSPADAARQLDSSIFIENATTVDTPTSSPYAARHQYHHRLVPSSSPQSAHSHSSPSGSTISVSSSPNSNITGTARSVPTNRLSSSPMTNTGVVLVSVSPSFTSKSWSPNNSPHSASGRLYRNRNHRAKSSPSALALEGEWDKFVSPFWLLATAEALYSRLEHISTAFTTSPATKANVTAAGRTRTRTSTTTDRSSHVRKMVETQNESGNGTSGTDTEVVVAEMAAKKLQSMYQKVGDDLIAIQETLCDPILGSVNAPPPPPPPPQSAVDTTLSSTSSMERKDGSADIASNNTEPNASGTADIGTGEQRDQQQQQQKQQQFTTAYNAAYRLYGTINALLTMIRVRKKLIFIHLNLVCGTLKYCDDEEDTTGNDGSGSNNNQNYNNMHGVYLNADGKKKGQQRLGIYDNDYGRDVESREVNTENKIGGERKLVDDMGIGIEKEEMEDEEEENQDGESLFYIHLSNRCQHLLSSSKLLNNDNLDDCEAMRPVIGTLCHEIKAMSAALAASHHLTYCNFFETVIHVKKLQLNIKALSSCSHSHASAATTTTIANGSLSTNCIWLNLILSGLRSKMSIYFDRIDAFSSTVNGFNKQFFVNNGAGGRQPASFSSNMPSDAIRKPGSKSKTKLENNHSSSMGRKAAEQQNVGDDNPLQQNYYFSERVDYDSKVIDFLSKHDNKGGLPMVIATIFDAKVGSLAKFERGFICSSSSSPSISKDDSSSSERSEPTLFYDLQSLMSNEGVDGLRSWPAIYLRSTLHSTLKSDIGGSHSSGGSGNVAVRGGNPFKKPSNRSNPSEFFNSNSAEGTSPTSKSPHAASFLSFTSYLGQGKKSSGIGNNNDKSNNSHTEKIKDADTVVPPLVKSLEYWPPAGNKEWPFHEWPSIVSLLVANSSINRYNCRRFFGSRVFTHRDKGIPQDVLKSSSSIFLKTAIHDKGGPSNVSRDEKSLLSGNGETNQGTLIHGADSANADQYAKTDFEKSKQSSLTTTYHYVQLAPRMWLISIVKGEEEKWHRRKSKGHSDEEVRSFLFDLASDLVVEKMFSWSAINFARLKAENIQQTVFSSGQYPSSEVAMEATTMTEFWSGWYNRDMHQLLGSFKNMVGLRKNDSIIEPLESPSHSRSTKPIKTKNTYEGASAIECKVSPSVDSVGDNIDSSACHFFLGPDIKPLFS